MLDRGAPFASLQAQVAPGLPVERFAVGKTIEEVVATLPRLFNLCRGAQQVALEAALGRPTDPRVIARDVLRDHLLKFHVTWPGYFGLPHMPLPEDWAEGGPDLVRAVFGHAAAPGTPQEFRSFLDSDRQFALSLRRIAAVFGPGEAAAEGLAPVTLENIWAAAACENSVAARHADHPVLRDLEARLGRGPLWRATARLYDFEAAALGRLPDVARGTGSAMVPAARGAYAIYMETEAGRVSVFRRVTPTDGLLAKDGILERALANLPPEKTGLGPLLLDILDPCCPVRLREVADA